MCGWNSTRAITKVAVARSGRQVWRSLANEMSEPVSGCSTTTTCSMPSHCKTRSALCQKWSFARAQLLTLCGHIEIKTDRNGRDEKHCGSTTEVLLSR